MLYEMDSRFRGNDGKVTGIMELRWEWRSRDENHGMTMGMVEGDEITGDGRNGGKSGRNNKLLTATNGLAAPPTKSPALFFHRDCPT